MNRRLVALLATAVLLAGCSDGSEITAIPVDEPTETSDTTAAPEDAGVYADPDSWLCRPDRDDDACDVDLDASVIAPDGSVEVERFAADEDAPIDCFYVYPTVSLDPGANSDMEIGDEERAVARQQAARLAASCRLYAPVYRQFTLAEIGRWFNGESQPFNGMDLAVSDVRDAWRHYLEHDNDGRGVVLVGHSQGSMVLSRLLAEDVEPDTAQRARLVSALLIGTTQHASDLPAIPPCTAAADTGCIVSYASYRSTVPPGPGSLFGGADAGEPAICTNPAALGGGTGELDPYFSADSGSFGVEVETPFVTLPGLVSAACVDRDGYHFLELTVHGDPDTPRVDDIGGDLGPQWGMHRIDVNVAMGDLVELIRGQAEAFSSR